MPPPPPNPMVVGSILSETFFSSQDGCGEDRVLALAYKKLDPEIGPTGARSLPRDQVEADLKFAGFAILQCPLKPESEPALRQLRDASHQLVMITGDAPLTAVHAASRVHIVDRPTLILQHR
jgi:manganese-transporting P-type ATPase